MKVLENKSKPIKLSVVCCQHGDELIGSAAYKYFSKNMHKFPGLQIIFAHEDAYAQKKRFIETDLNRSYPGSAGSSLEEKLAAKILNTCKDAEYVLDLHTTTADIKVVPIVGGFSSSIKLFLNYLPLQDVVVMDKERAKTSLIGQIPNGISLEYNENFAKNPTVLTELNAVVTNILEGNQQVPLSRRIYFVKGLIPNEQTIPLNSNFKYLSSMKVTPFLVGEKSYKTFKAFNLHRPTRAII